MDKENHVQIAKNTETLSNGHNHDPLKEDSHVNGRIEKLENSHKAGPSGGYDSSPIPDAPPGFTIKIVFHKATNLPISDLNSFSSDPYVIARLDTNLTKRHKEDPPLDFRTPTVRRSVNPEWNYEWIIANVPTSGFRLKARVYDEDPADRDDRLGNAHINVSNIGEDWMGIDGGIYPLKWHMASKRAYLMRCAAVVLSVGKVKFVAHLHVSIHVLGKSLTEHGGRAYTVGPNWWTRHYSPLLGLMTGSKGTGRGSRRKKGGKPERYNFQANQFQLQGPVPADLYHRYVEFRPMITAMFTSSGIKGLILNRTLHRQHSSVYRFDRATARGKFEQPCKDMTLHFLEQVHFDSGNRLFTYIITLDSVMRFTETGKEFGIDFLSKHTMHSNVSVYIAYSGEFFVRRYKNHQRKRSALSSISDRSPVSPKSQSSTKSHRFSFRRFRSSPVTDEPEKDPSLYELVIDNDSGTYRPDGKLLPQLKQFLERNFPGLHIRTLDSQADAEVMNKLKGEQRERKKAGRHHMVYRQVRNSSSSSISSSDEEDLVAMADGEAAKEKRILKQLQDSLASNRRTTANHVMDIKPGRREEHKNIAASRLQYTEAM